MCDYDWPSLEAYSAIEWCLQKFQNGANFESVGQVKEVVGASVQEVRTKGDFVLMSSGRPGEWAYQQRMKSGEPFDSGILLKCVDRTLFIDPCWGVFSDTDLPKEWQEQFSEPLDLPVKGTVLEIREEFVRGRMQVTVRFERDVLTINDFERTIKTQAAD